MKSIARILMAGTAAATLLTGAASAGQWNNNNVLNGQLNLADTWSVANVSIDWIMGCVKVASVAIGNTFTASLEGSSYVRNNQRNTGIVGAELNANVVGVSRTVDLSSAAIANNATISVYDAYSTDVNSTQFSGGYDPSASVNAYIGGVGGNVTISSVAVANNLGVNSAADTTNVTSRQINSAGTYATVNATINGVNGNIDVSSAAIANSVTVGTTRP